MNMFSHLLVVIMCTCLYRKTANRHFLKSMARVGAGYEEFFDPKTKSKWQRKVIYNCNVYTFLHTNCILYYWISCTGEVTVE